MSKTLPIAAALALGSAACTKAPSFLVSNDKAVVSYQTPTKQAAVSTDGAGRVVATIDPSNGETQTIAADGVSGAAIAFPPGSLGVATDVTVEEGVSMVTESLASDLGLGADASFSQASKPVVITSAAKQDAVVPFSVSLSVDGSGLTADTRHLVVIYTVIRYDQGGRYFSGVIPESEIKSAGGKLTFATKYFGSYQLAYVTVAITAPVQVQAKTQAIATKATKTDSSAPASQSTATADKPATTESGDSKDEASSDTGSEKTDGGSDGSSGTYGQEEESITSLQDPHPLSPLASLGPCGWVQDTQLATVAPANVALGKPVLASSNEADDCSRAASAVDGDPNSRWSSNSDKAGPGAAHPHYLVVDLETPVTLADIKVDIAGYDNWQQDFRVYVSPDGQAWTYVDGRLHTSGQYVFTNLPGSPVQYILYESYYSADHGQVNLYELEAHTAP